MIDLRMPIGLFFLMVGILLLTAVPARARIDGGPVNLFAGLCMLAFGAVMLWLARRAR